ncbi:spore cortex biosynthesis protein YabQ [Natroniella sulfidigena]|uniref:spore cortex biosynthesis protein YabQ n=1 Tax=Natroniella sulfidigena TaxID=723921 RepID=UPI00200A1E99|nr:spore cortex biosynthesis protein YabQ [Natroniella sulfidigena]MCK8817006.1 spore cortex biosynthesis protein YabQ [Natroniella sulfidigena]
MVSLRLQAFTFLNMMMIGVVIGFFFDFYRVLRGKCQLGRVATDLFDLLFCLAVTLFVFLGLIYSNQGQVRLYIFIGVISGEVIYYLTISKYSIIFFQRVVKLIGVFYQKIKSIVLLIYNRLKSILLKIKEKFKEIFKR